MLIAVGGGRALEHVVGRLGGGEGGECWRCRAADGGVEDGARHVLQQHLRPDERESTRFGA